MFNVWYNEYGKELAKNALPIDDIDEKEIRPLFIINRNK